MKQPLVLLPGLGSDGALWAAQVRDLADVARPVLGDTLQDTTLPDMARRVLAAAPDRFALAGLSMGGYLAFETLRQAPERVTRLALLDTSARADTAEQTEARHAAMDAAARYDFAALARSGLDRLVARTASKEVRDAVVAMSLRVGRATWQRQQHAIIARPDARDLLARIAVPTLVLVGEEDALTPPSVAEEIAAGIAGATLVRVAGSGHLSTMEQPAAVTAAMRAWLGR